jgi:fibronectin type 3 domain-containing protein
LSDFSDVISVTTKPKPKQPEGLKGTYEAGKSELSWSVNKEDDIAHYVVYEKVFLGTQKIAEVKTPNYSDGSIVKGKNKIYVVTAVDSTGLESEISAEFTVSAK